MRRGYWGWSARTHHTAAFRRMAIFILMSAGRARCTLHIYNPCYIIMQPLHISRFSLCLCPERTTSCHTKSGRVLNLDSKSAHHDCHSVSRSRLDRATCVCLLLIYYTDELQPRDTDTDRRTKNELSGTPFQAGGGRAGVAVGGASFTAFLCFASSSIVGGRTLGHTYE